MSRRQAPRQAEHQNEEHSSSRTERRVDRRSVLAGLTAAAAVGSNILVDGKAHAATPSDPVVETTAGKVRGERAEAGGFKFLCVPYGASTAGAGRFMPPKPVAPWPGVREQKQALIAPQIDPNAPARAPGTPGAAVAAIGSEAGSLETEDCLNVTIYTPAPDSARRPVMFWCHGGGFFAGSGSNPMYDGARLATRGDVVVVNVNHRLNVLGYAHLAAAGEEFASSGNVGMLDVELALRWVRDNIERFGGDPKRVMIFGQSGGGGKVAILSTMPSAKGLFHRAVMQSGAQREVRSAEQSIVAAEVFMQQLGLKPHQARELQQVPLQKLMAANFALGKVPSVPGRSLTFAPVLDGKVIPRHPFAPDASPLNANVPLIVGSVRTENTVFSLADQDAFRLDAAGLRTRLVKELGERTAEAAIGLYSKLKPKATPSDLYFEILSDRGRRQSILVAELKAAQRAGKAYLYELMWDTPVFDGMLRSPHSIDLPMVFDIARGSRWAPYTGGGEDAQKIATAMSNAWVAFAHTGNPGTRALPWPAYSADKREMMLFDETSQASPDPIRQTRRFWDEAAATS